MKQIPIAVMRALLRAGLDLGRAWPLLQRWLDAAALRIRPPAGVTVLPRRYGTVVGQWIVPADAPKPRCVLYLDDGDAPAARVPAYVTRIAAAAGTRIFRSAASDAAGAVAAWRALRQQGFAASDIAIAGAGRGAALALSVLVDLRDNEQALPEQALLISPRLDQREGASAGHPGRPAALLTADLRGLPPLLIHAGGDEMHLDVTGQLQANAQASGVDVRLRIWPDLGPVFHAFAPYLREADDAIANLAAPLRSAQRGEAVQPLIRATFAPRLPPRIDRIPSHAARGA